MTVPPEHGALAHIEKTLADSYRKEIDQEENVWRTLPFFAATLALQLAALFQLVERLPPFGTWLGVMAYACLTLSGLATATALGFLAACIYPRKFQYLAPDPELLNYALGLIQDEKAHLARPGQTGFSAIVTLKEALARQYAVGAQHNRRINKMRERLRSIAGLATVASVVLTLGLVVTTSLEYVPVITAETEAHGQSAAQEAAGQQHDGAGRAAARNPPRAADAGGDQGVVGSAGGAGERRGAGEGGE